MAEKEDHMTTHETTNGDGLPPVRSGNIFTTKESVSITVYHRVWLYKQQSSSTQSSKSNATRIKSGDYKAWDKYDVEKELAAAETSTTSSSQTTSLPQLFTEKGY